MMKSNLLGAVLALSMSSGWCFAQTHETQVVDAPLGVLNGFGYSVGMSGDYAVLRCKTSAQEVLIYERTGSTWAEVQRLSAPGPDYYTWGSEGRATVSGDVAVCQMRALTPSGWADALGVLERAANGVWAQTQVITSSAPLVSETFGLVSAISGNYMVVGAPWDTELGLAWGAVFFFEKQGGLWKEVQKVFSSDIAQLDRFGDRVALCGTTAIIGTWAKGANTGSAYVFERQANGLWVETQILAPSHLNPAQLFASSLGLDGDVLIVGAEADNEVAFNAGAAYVFQRQADGTWLEVQKLVPTDAGALRRFGTLVGVSGDVAVIDSDPKWHGSTDTAFAFRRQADGTWVETEVLRPSSGSVVHYSDLALSGKTAMLGSGSDLGTVFVYEIGDCVPDLGHGGPGSLRLSACGGDMTQDGTTGTFLLSGGSSSSVALLFAGLSSNPTAIPGTLGTLVPLPVLPGFPLVIPLDTTGTAVLPLSGGATLPLSIILQAVAQDGAVTAFSNAIQLTIGS